VIDRVCRLVSSLVGWLVRSLTSGPSAALAGGAGRPTGSGALYCLGAGLI